MTMLIDGAIGDKVIPYLAITPCHQPTTSAFLLTTGGNNVDHDVEAARIRRNKHGGRESSVVWGQIMRGFDGGFVRVLEDVRVC